MSRMTFEELLHQSTDPVRTGPTLAVDADITLEDSVLDAVNRHFLADEPSLVWWLSLPMGRHWESSL